MKSGSSAFISSAGQSCRRPRGDLVTSRQSRPRSTRPAAGALDHEAFDLVVAMQKRLVDVVLQLRHAAAARAPSAVIDHLGVAAVDPRAERVGREAGEDDGMDGADPRAGQHRVGGLGDHRQVEDDAVARRRPAPSGHWPCGRPRRAAACR
jgi:hypothetical protein